MRAERREGWRLGGDNHSVFSHRFTQAIALPFSPALITGIIEQCGIPLKFCLDFTKIKLHKVMKEAFKRTAGRYPSSAGEIHLSHNSLSLLYFYAAEESLIIAVALDVKGMILWLLLCNRSSLHPSLLCFISSCARCITDAPTGQFGLLQQHPQPGLFSSTFHGCRHRACVGSHTRHATSFVILIYGFTHFRNDSVQVKTEPVGAVLTVGAEERLPCLQLLHKQWSDVTLKQIQLLILLCKGVAVGTVWQLATEMFHF